MASKIDNCKASPKAPTLPSPASPLRLLVMETRTQALSIATPTIRQNCFTCVFTWILATKFLDPSYLWVAPNIELEDAEIVAGHCRSIARDRPPIWFSIRADAKTKLIEVRGKVSLKSPYEGMNCATFVLAVFQWAGPMLVDLKGWKKRPRDKKWHEQLIKWLQARKSPAWYVKKVTKDIGCIRVRPEEVAGACLGR